MTRKFLFVIIAILLGIFIFMSEEKTFTPTVIQDIPLPGTEPVANSVSAGYSNTTKAGAPSNISNAPFKQKAVSQETIASSLNTKSKKIQGEYTFTQQGAIKVGEYQNGVSGEMKLSPAGITAKNKSGNTTFAIDGETGDAVFQGEIRAADFVVSDENGLVSLSNFFSDSVTTGTLFTTASATPVDITGMTLTVELDRPAFAIILYTCVVYGTQTAVPGSDFGGQTEVFLSVNGTLTGGTLMRTIYDSSVPTSNADRDTLSGHSFRQLDSGLNTIKLQTLAFSFSNYTTAIQQARMTYVILGR